MHRWDQSKVDAEMAGPSCSRGGVGAVEGGGGVGQVHALLILSCGGHRGLGRPWDWAWASRPPPPSGCSDAGLVGPQAPLVSSTDQAVVLLVSRCLGFGREAAIAGQSPGPSRGSCLQPASSTLGPAFGRLGASVWLLPRVSLTRVLWRRGLEDRRWAADGLTGGGSVAGVSLPHRTLWWPRIPVPVGSGWVWRVGVLLGQTLWTARMSGEGRVLGSAHRPCAGAYVRPCLPQLGEATPGASGVLPRGALCLASVCALSFVVLVFPKYSANSY